MVAVFVVDGEQMQRIGFELARAFRADPAVEGEGFFALAFAPGAPGLLGFADQRIDVGGRPGAFVARRAKAARGHGWVLLRGRRVEKGVGWSRSIRGDRSVMVRP